MIGGNSYKATVDTARRRRRRARRQVRLADGRCGGIDSQIEVEVKFTNNELAISLLILPGVEDPLVLGWNFLTRVGTEIRCARHEIIISARKWLEEKQSVAVVQQTIEVNYTTTFLETKLADLNTMTGTSYMAEHQIKMKNGEEIAVHQQLGPKGWILADPTGRRQYTDQAKVCSSGG